MYMILLYKLSYRKIVYIYTVAILQASLVRIFNSCSSIALCVCSDLCSFTLQLPVNLHTLCQWGKGSKAKISHLTNSLIKLLQTSDGVYIVSPPPLPQATAAMATIPTPWHRPRPSVLAFHIVHCLRAIAHHQGWVWTNDTLIRAHLWPLLQQWNANRDAVRETTVVCAVRLIGKSKLNFRVLLWYFDITILRQISPSYRVKFSHDCH